MMNLEHYNRSYEEIVEILDDEVEQKMRTMRQHCVSEFINRLNQRESEWAATFQELLEKSREDDIKSAQEASSLLDLANTINKLQNSSTANSFSSKPIPNKQISEIPKDSPIENLAKENSELKSDVIIPQTKPLQSTVIPTQNKTLDPFFTNDSSIKEFVRIQQILHKNRELLHDINTNPTHKTFKNEINIFIRTQINSISNSDSQHLKSKIKLLSDLLIGQGVNFQDKFVSTQKHPQGQLFSVDLAAQTFVNVGIKLVNSVPAIAKSMGVVINGIVEKNLPEFRDLVIGHLQEQCPYLVPMHLDREDFSKDPNLELRYKIACGYSYDQKSQALESEEKYLVRMRSMTLIYACFLVENHLGMAWTWLASFLSLKPQAVISATILQAFLQEASKKISSTYGRQYKKLVNFIKEDYIKMVEEITPKTSDRQSLIKLKNLLSDDANLIAGPTMSSIFGAIRC